MSAVGQEILWYHKSVTCYVFICGILKINVIGVVVLKLATTVI